MFWIIGSLFTGWFLSLFGFDNTVITGMFQVFDISITSASYYFIFGIIGALNWVLSNVGNARTLKLNNKDNKERLEEFKNAPRNHSLVEEMVRKKH